MIDFAAIKTVRVSVISEWNSNFSLEVWSFVKITHAIDALS